MFNNFDIQDDEDCVFGNYKNTNIIISKTRLTLPINGLENRNIFKGIVIQLEIEKNIQNNIIITLKNTKNTTKLQLLEINNKNFKAFGANQNNLEIINESLFDILENILISNNADDIKFSFNNKTILIFLAKKSPQRIGSIYKSVYSIKNYDKLINQFVAIFNLVDLINN